ncbi:MAG: GntR family transcriptional regulator [Chloroflexi bacterium]|nr:GntR family transcriptional regulator [Chloroflexota bacterium]
MIEKSYVQMKAHMMAGIASGQFKPHDRLPSQRELGRQYGLSHMSVRRAINELANAGIIYSLPGKGLYVAEPKQEAELGALVSFTDDMTMRGMAASTRTLRSEIVGASTMLANLLQVVVGAPLAHLRRLRLADGAPMAIQENYLVLAHCPDLLKHDLERDSLYAVLRQQYGLQLADGERSVEAVMATPEEAELLELSLPAALLVSEQITFLAGGVPIEFVRSAYRGDRYRLRIQEK